MPAHPLASIADYEAFIYALPDTFECIQMSTLVVVHTGPVTAVLKGELYFERGLVLRVLEVVDTHKRRIERYGYEVWPHPDTPELASTHPHHKHVPPDVKHNRIPAPGLSFDSPNLPFLIQGIEQTCLLDL